MIEIDDQTMPVMLLRLEGENRRLIQRRQREDQAQLPGRRVLVARNRADSRPHSSRGLG